MFLFKVQCADPCSRDDSDLQTTPQTRRSLPSPLPDNAWCYSPHLLDLPFFLTRDVLFFIFVLLRECLVLVYSRLASNLLDSLG